MTAVLEAHGLVKKFGGVRAVNGVSLAVPQHSICGLIGPNGSGKTTLLGVLAGTHRADEGTLILEGMPLPRRHAHRFVRAGVARTFQTTKLFSAWTLRDNLKLAEQEQREDGISRRTSILDAARVVGLEQLLGVPCHRLTNAEQRLSMIAMAVATHPKLVLLDEPAVGMSQTETERLATAILGLRDDLEMSVVVVEHNMHFLMRLVEKVTVMFAGTVLAEGTPAEVRSNPDVIASYLGS